jgi:inosine kinase
MKFPGKRKSKHYFPVNARDPLLQQIQPENETSAAWVVGIDQTLVDIEAKVDDAFVARYGLSAGHSLVIEDDVAEALYQELVRENLITHQFAGGTIGNTMHNYSVLADDRSVLLGVMCSNIEIGGYAYRYLCNTSSRTDLNYLQGVDGPIGRCFTLISDSGERTFAISPGHMNKLRADSIPEEVIAGASALVLTSYLVRCKPGEPMPEATMKAIEYAKKYDVPVVLTLGTKFVIADNPEWWQAFLKEHVSILAMNEEEAEALTGESDPLLASDKALDWVDLVLCTAGPVGLYMAGFTEEESKRKTQHPLLPGAIAEFNQYEFSRACAIKMCESAAYLLAHRAVYGRAGEDHEHQRRGRRRAGGAAARHHRQRLPQNQRANSSKHKFSWLTYSSLAQVCKYANRVSYQVLNQHSPRLTRGLPEREDSLEEAYWDR